VAPDLPDDAFMDPGPDGAPVFVTADTAAAPVAVDWTAGALPRPWTWRPAAFPPPLPWRARDLADGDTPPPAGRSVLPMSPGASWWSAPGRRPLLAPPATAAAAYALPVSHALEGRVVVVDALGDGADPDGTGPTGVTGTSVNRGTARALARLLAGLGAVPVLTDGLGSQASPMAKVALAGREGAAFFVSVGRSADGEPAQVLHHPGSRVGAPWAAATAGALASLLPDSARATPSWNYLLRHTACPALEVRLPHAASVDDEVRLESPAWQAAEARGLLLGLVGALAGADSLPTVRIDDVLPSLPGAPDAAAVDWALWDGEVPWYPLPRSGEGPDGSLASWRDPGLPAQGPLHTLELHAGDAWQLWLIRTGPGAAGGTLLRSGEAAASATPTP
jgi:N-acetylmuramoyl-L-alanine amidase